MSSKHAAYFIFDEAVKGSTSNFRIAHYEEYQNLYGDNILQQDKDFNCLFYSDTTFNIPIPGNMMPFSIFPQLNLDIQSVDLRLLSGNRETTIPHLFFSASSLNKENTLTIKFHHKDELIPTIEQSFHVKIDASTKLQNLLQPFFEQVTWRPSIEHIASQLAVDVNRIVLYHSTNGENQVLFPFQKINPFMNKLMDMSTGKYIFNGKFTFEILPNIYDNIESHEMQMKDKFIDKEEERNSYFNSLPPPLMAQLVNFQKKIFNSINKDTMRNFFTILTQLISAEFNFDAFDKILIIGLKHILSATLIDIIIPYLISVTKRKQLYRLKTWKDLSSWFSQNAKPNFLSHAPKDDVIDSMCIIYFVITHQNFPEKVVNLTYRFLNHYMVKASDLRNLPPVQINCFLGDPIYSTSVRVNNKNDYVLLLTRGFIYLINASIDEPKKEILPEKLNLKLQSSESFSITLLNCYILPLPSEPQTIAFLGSEGIKIIINFPNPESQLTFITLLHVAKSEIKKTTIYPLQVPKSSVHFVFMKDKINAKVNVSGISWEVFFSPEDVFRALERAGSGQMFKILPSNEQAAASRLNYTKPIIQYFERPVEVDSLLGNVLGSDTDTKICHLFNNSWAYSVLSDMLFSFSSKSSFEGLRVLKISDFSHAISLDSKELLQIQCEYFKSYLPNFTVNNTPLLFYASLVCTDSAIIRFLIETKKMSKDDGSRYKRTPYFYALRNPNISILQALLDYSDLFSIESAAIIDNVNISPLIYCIENNDEQRALLLLRNGALVHNSLETDSASALEYVISKKNEKMLNLIMPFCGPQINSPNVKGKFATHLCIEAGFFQGLRIIEALDPFFNPNMCSDVCPHPLHAFLEGEKRYTAVDLMSLLRLAKIDVNALNSKHETPLMSALIKGHNDLVRNIAKDPRCDLDLYNEEGMSALSLAVKYKNIDAIKILIEAGALVDQPNQDGKTPLFYALSQESVNKDICRILIASSRVYHWYSNGQLPYDIAPDDLKAEIERRKPPQFNIIPFRYDNHSAASQNTNKNSNVA